MFFALFASMSFWGKGQMMKNKEGLTLIEVMFVVAIIGLLASIGIPAILNAMKHAQEKVRQAHITSVEKAKSMLTLPALVYAHGRGLTSGAVFGEGEYTEDNLLSCIKNISDLEELKVGGQYLIPGNIGEKTYYTKDMPSYASD